MKRALVPACAILLLAAAPAVGASRQEVLDRAAARWMLGDGGKGAAVPLKQSGAIKVGVDAEGEGALPGGKAARMSDAYFDAGKDLTVTGNGITVYLRARDPKGQWSYGLFCKRGGHDVVTFNLFSVDLGGTPGPDIGFEVHSKNGFVMVSFPVSDINAVAWHDFAGRYDGKTIEVICDGKVMAKKRWKGGDLTQNAEPVLIGAETDNGQVVRPFTGEMEEAALWSRALRDDEVAVLMRKESVMPCAGYVEPYASPIHYRPEVGRLADTIPFFWQGQYHIFYLRAIEKVPWEHIASTNLIHWWELPTALVSDGKPDGPDGLHMFTGSVTEKDGAFHIFYTGWNPANREGREWVMHATSPDLIAWTKHPEHGFRGDEVHYQNSDFRDPYVFWNDGDKRYWMILCARDAKTGKPVQGVAVSNDLVKWEQVEPLTLEPPLGEGTPECPDLFKIDDTYYLIHSPSAGTTDMRYADNIRGPYRLPPAISIDTPILYAAKRMFDGKRHVITGWIRDLSGEKDGGGFEWGGDQSVPRQVYAGPGGQLLFRPVAEAAAAFSRTVLELANRPEFKCVGEQWRYTDGGLVAEPAEKGARCLFDVPENYMLLCRIQLEPKAVFTLAMRDQDATDSGYRLTLRPEIQEAEIAGATFNYPRKIVLDAATPITLEVFVQGSIIECFVNDAYAFSCRAYDFRQGRLAMDVSGGKATVLRLTARTHQ